MLHRGQRDLQPLLQALGTQALTEAARTLGPHHRPCLVGCAPCCCPGNAAQKAHLRVGFRAERGCELSRGKLPRNPASARLTLRNHIDPGPQVTSWVSKTGRGISKLHTHTPCPSVTVAAGAHGSALLRHQWHFLPTQVHHEREEVTRSPLEV